MFTTTMSDAEIEREARKEFFELSTKIRIAIDRFNHRHCDLINCSGLQMDDTPITLISKSTETLKWRTRRNNIWTSHFRFNNGIAGDNITIVGFLYTVVHREHGTEYIFLNNLNSPIAERFTLHFIERYKERHLKPRGIDTGAMAIPLYFQIHNPKCIMGRYYKTSDIGIEESKYKKFWIAPEGIYVTDYIEGMLTYITFMDKDDLSPLKKQVYEEEIVWDFLLRAINPKLNDDERARATYGLVHTPDLGRILERFAKRNVADDDDGEKQKLLKHIKEEMAGQESILKEVMENNKQQEKEKLRKNRVTGTLDTNTLIDELEIKEYDIKRCGK